MLQTRQSEPAKVELNSERSWLRRLRLAQILGLASIVFGLVAVARVCHIILTVGGNNISNDYLDVVPFINLAFSGQIDTSNILNNFKVGQHIVALPIAFHLLSAYLFDWNARAELLIGVGLNLIKALLLWDLVARGHKKEWQPLIFGVVLALVFSMTQASVHFFGQACFPVSLTTLGFTVALWGISRFQNDWRGVTLMLAGGVGAAASMGNVPPCWFALLLGLVFYGYSVKRWPVYLAWLAGAVVSIAPYAYFAMAKPAYLSSAQHGISWIFMINLLGRPFANQVGLNVGRLPMAEYIGIAGLVMFALALGANWRLRRWSLPAKTALVLCAYGLSSALMLSCVRTYVTPWYGSFAIYFWIGLIGLLMSALQSESSEETVSKARTALFWKLSCILCLAIIPIFYCMSNRSWEDKHVYLITRTPASESALRNFREAPSYIEAQLFQWGDGKAKNVTNLAKAPERYQLSAFAPDQTWTLQGDFSLPRVRVFNSDQLHPARFIEDKTADHSVPWSHYEHANLYVHAPNVVSWTLSLPADMHSARLKTALTIGSPGKRVMPAITDGVTGKIFVVVGDPLLTSSKQLLLSVHASKAGQWLPLECDLSQFKGKTVTLVFTCDGGKDKQDDFSVFQYPSIDVKLRRRSAAENQALACQLDAKPEPWRPVNSDLSADFGKNFDVTGKLDLPPLTDSSWRRAPLAVALPSSIKGEKTDKPSDFSAMYFTPAQSMDVSEFSYLTVSLRVPETMPWRSLRVELILADGKRHSFSIPVAFDASLHTCSFDLKLCEIPPNSLVKQLVLYPVAAPGTVTTDSIAVESVSFVKEKRPAWHGH
ncbi:MAG: hypothetical protein C0469_12855 [Cyanobacteria bacterium DS2.3.42]|nr:hypothetical protein [Cyanobacteria bacterium DS2.3.42]